MKLDDLLKSSHPQPPDEGFTQVVMRRISLQEVSPSPEENEIWILILMVCSVALFEFLRFPAWEKGIVAHPLVLAMLVGVFFFQDWITSWAL
jgi:hypothetical protein